MEGLNPYAVIIILLMLLVGAKKCAEAIALDTPIPDDMKKTAQKAGHAINAVLMIVVILLAKDFINYLWTH